MFSHMVGFLMPKLLAENHASAGITAHRLCGGHSGHATCKQSKEHKAHKYTTQKLGVSRNS
jgi:hypothetical protein